MGFKLVIGKNYKSKEFWALFGKKLQIRIDRNRPPPGLKLVKLYIPSKISVVTYTLS